MPAAQRPWPVVREYSRGHNRAAAIVDYDRLAQAFMQLLTEYTADDVGAAMDETRIVPIVFVRVADPLGDGVVDSMAKPSGNVTGFSVLEPSIAGKWLQLLREIAPGVAPVTVMFNPATAPYRAGSDFLRVAETAAPLLGMEVKAAHVHDVAEIEPVIAAVAREGNGGLISLPDIFVSTALQPRAVCAGDDCLGDNCLG